MLLQIHGAGFSNKGAQLMIAAVCEALKARIPGVRLCIPLVCDPFTYRAHYDLYASVNTDLVLSGVARTLRRVAAKVAIDAMPQRWRDAVGIVREKDVDGLLDISGYAFGDKWPVGQTVAFARRAGALKRRGKPVVLLPQMLGPFSQPGQANAFRRMAECVDLIYAREQESFAYAKPLVAESKLRLAPDVTIPVSAKRFSPARHRYVCIVPNSKMLESNPGQKDWGDGYLQRLVSISQHLSSHGLEVKILQHEYNAGDTKLIEELQRKTRNGAYEVVKEFDPLALKGFLGNAELVIGSRFHSLVSSLSMGTPAIALGWAHKYDALLRDFGTPELIHRADDPPECLIELVDSTLAHRQDLVAVLTKHRVELSSKVDAMWTDVMRALGRPPYP